MIVHYSLVFPVVGLFWISRNFKIIDTKTIMSDNAQEKATREWDAMAGEWDDMASGH